MTRRNDVQLVIVVCGQSVVDYRLWKGSGMRHLLRKRVHVWRFAAALALGIVVSGVVPQAAFAQDDLQQPTSVTDPSPDGGKRPGKKCKGSTELAQPDIQCGW